MVSHICGIFFKNTKLIEKNNQICGYQKQGGGGEKELDEGGEKVQTSSYNINKY